MEHFLVPLSDGSRVWVDGIEPVDGGAVLQATKFVHHPGGPGVYEGTGSETAVEVFSEVFADEVALYQRAVEDPSTPFVGVEVFTNTARAQAFLSEVVDRVVGPGSAVSVVLREG